MDNVMVARRLARHIYNKSSNISLAEQTRRPSLRVKAQDFFQDYGPVIFIISFALVMILPRLPW